MFQIPIFWMELWMYGINRIIFNRVEKWDNSPYFVYNIISVNLGGYYERDSWWIFNLW